MRYGEEERSKMLLVGGNLHGGGGPAVKRRGRRWGGLGGESCGGRRVRGECEVEEMFRWGRGGIYIPTDLT